MSSVSEGVNASGSVARPPGVRTIRVRTRGRIRILRRERQGGREHLRLVVDVAAAEAVEEAAAVLIFAGVAQGVDVGSTQALTATCLLRRGVWVTGKLRGLT